MILQSLANKSQKVAEAVLVELTGGFLPNPTDMVDSDPFHPQNHSDVLKEIMQKTGLTADDNSEAAKTKILEVLSNQLTTLYLNDTKKFQLRTRIEHKRWAGRSELPIKYDSAFDFFISTGVDENEVRQAISSPDRLEYVKDDYTLDSKEFQGVGLALKRRINENTGKPFDFLVIFDRKAENITTTAAWRIFQDDIGYNSETMPLNIFLKFLDKYGYKISAGSSAPTKLIMGALWNFNFQSREGFFRMYGGQAGEEFYRAMSFAATPLNLLKGKFIYAVNGTMYRKTLVQHGFPQKSR